MSTTWHVTAAAARAYADGRLDDPSSWSLEAHVEQCGACARLMSSAADPVVLAQVRGRVDAQVRWRSRGFVRLTVTPALSVAWLAAVVGVVAGVLALDAFGATRVPSVLLVAPLLPLVGLAVGCSPAVDRGAELMASTPMSTLHVLLLRAGAVLAVSVPPLLVASLATGTGPLRWLAPSAGLVGLALALTTRMRVEAAAGCAAALWAAATLGPVALRAPSPPGLQPDLAFGWLVLAVACLVLLTVRQEHLDRWSDRKGARR